MFGINLPEAVVLLVAFVVCAAVVVVVLSMVYSSAVRKGIVDANAETNRRNSVKSS